MSKLYLTTCFHGNLLSSSIPQEQYSYIIDRCYWSVIELLRDYDDLKFGIETPFTTLEVINEIDASLVATINRLIDRDKLQYVFSGYTQAIQPLLPYAVNKANLEIGYQKCKEIIASTGRIAYLNEQTISQSTASLYEECGFDSVIMDYDGCKLACGYDTQLFYEVPKIQNSSVNMLWNSAIVFQRFQRYISGQIDLQTYYDYVLSHYSPSVDRYLMLYGSDWEIFDYRPGDIDLKYTKSQEEIERFRALVERLLGDTRVEFRLPSSIIKRFSTQQVVDVSSAEHPVPTKKQSTYNISRWAVCGRDNAKSNRDCYDLARESFGRSGERHEDQVEALRLFSSDYRSFTTDSKYQEFVNQLAGRKAGRGERNASTGAKVRVDNHNEFDWEYTYEFAHEFEAGMFYQLPVIRVDGDVVKHQYEDMEYYRDESIRCARVVVELNIAAGRSVVLEFAEEQKDAAPMPPSVTKLDINEEKGATIGALTFCTVCSEPLCGMVSHHEYGDIRVSTDQFSGHMLLYTVNGDKIVDLAGAEDVTVSDDMPIRNTITARITTPLGKIWKTYYIYRERSRIDLVYHFRFSDFQPGSFRLGTLTLMPEVFDRSSMYYATVNGTREVEKYSLSGKNVNHGKPVSVDVSSHYCLGATEGWVAVGDKDKGVAVVTDKSTDYCVGMIEYQEPNNKPYLRVYSSVAESDATSQHFWRGHNQFRITYVGFCNDLAEVRSVSRANNASLGLAVVQ